MYKVFFFINALSLVLSLTSLCMLLYFYYKGKDEPMGRCRCPPLVKLNPSVAVSPKLLWFPVTKKGRSAGEVLLAAELLLKDKVKMTLRKDNILQLNFMKINVGGHTLLCPSGR